jgi:hypothetical protein
MKKILMIAALMVATLSASAQGMYLKPMVGGTLSTMTGDGSDDAKMKVGLVAGAEFGYDFTENMGLTAGLLYTMEGCKSKALDKNMNLDYLNIPILFNYYVIPGLALKAGVQPGFLMRAKLDGNDMKDFYKKFDLAIPLGASYEFSDFVIDARYNLGALFNIADHGDNKAHNSVIQLTLGYKIPF